MFTEINIVDLKFFKDCKLKNADPSKEEYLTIEEGDILGSYDNKYTNTHYIYFDNNFFILKFEEGEKLCKLCIKVKEEHELEILSYLLGNYIENAEILSKSMYGKLDDCTQLSKIFNNLSHQHLNLRKTIEKIKKKCENINEIEAERDYYKILVESRRKK